MKLLQVDSSILGPNSVSRLLTQEVVQAQKKLHPDLEVKVYDLGAEPIAHLSGAYLAAGQLSPTSHTPELQHDLARSEQALEDFLAADVIVIGAPMYNFGIPSQLKAWIDRLAVAGKTFRYTETGVEGLVKGKKIIVVSSRGGFYGAETPMGAFDHQENYLKSIFGFIGVTDLEFVRAEGVAMGPEQKKKSLQTARESIAVLV